MDRWPPARHSRSNLRIELFMDKFNVTEIWREKFLDDISFTWSNCCGSRKSHIDFWLISNSLSKDDITFNLQQHLLTLERYVSMYNSETNHFNRCSRRQALSWQPVHEEEVLENNNSPDTDGLGAELYKSFSSQLAPFLFQVFNESFERGSLPPSLTQGLIDFFSLKRTYILLITGDW